MSTADDAAKKDVVGNVDDVKDRDYSELGQEVAFNFMGKKYTIPTIPRSKSRELFQLARNHRKEMAKLEKERPEDEKDVVSEKEVEQVTKFQNEYITSVVTNTSIEDMDNWPTSLINKVMSLINEIIAGEFGEEKKA